MVFRLKVIILSFILFSLNATAAEINRCSLVFEDSSSKHFTFAEDFRNHQDIAKIINYIFGNDNTFTSIDNLRQLVSKYLKGLFTESEVIDNLFSNYSIYDIHELQIKYRPHFKLIKNALNSNPAKVNPKSIADRLHFLVTQMMLDIPELNRLVHARLTQALDLNKVSPVDLNELILMGQKKDYPAIKAKVLALIKSTDRKIDPTAARSVWYFAKRLSKYGIDLPNDNIIQIKKPIIFYKNSFSENTILDSNYIFRDSEKFLSLNKNRYLAYEGESSLYNKDTFYKKYFLITEAVFSISTKSLVWNFIANKNIYEMYHSIDIENVKNAEKNNKRTKTKFIKLLKKGLRYSEYPELYPLTIRDKNIVNRTIDYFVKKTLANKLNFNLNAKDMDKVKRLAQQIRFQELTFANKIIYRERFIEAIQVVSEVISYIILKKEVLPELLIQPRDGLLLYVKPELKFVIDEWILNMLSINTEASRGRVLTLMDLMQEEFIQKFEYIISGQLTPSQFVLDILNTQLEM